MSVCGVCGRQVETSDSGQPMPCVPECLKGPRPLDAFLAYAADSCVNPAPETASERRRMRHLEASRNLRPRHGEASVLRRMARVYSELALVARGRGEEALAQSHERAVKLFEEQAREVEAEYAADRFVPGGGER